MFVGLRDTIYECGTTSENMLYAVDTNIHHVEHWGSISQNVAREDYYGRKKAESLPPDGNVKNTEYYKEVVGYGKQCQKKYIEWKFENTMNLFDLGMSALFISADVLKQTSQLADPDFLELVNYLRHRPK